MSNHYWLCETDRRHPIVSWCNARAILCRKLWNVLDACWCSVLTVSHLSGSHMDHLLIPALNLHTGSTFRQFGLLLRASSRSKNRNHMAEGVRQPGECWQPPLKASGFYETGNTKATFTIKRPRAKGVSSLASMRREKIPRKTSAFAIMYSDCWLQAYVMAARPHFP